MAKVLVVVVVAALACLSLAKVDVTPLKSGEINTISLKQDVISYFSFKSGSADSILLGFSRAQRDKLDLMIKQVNDNESYENQIPNNKKSDYRDYVWAEGSAKVLTKKVPKFCSLCSYVAGITSPRDTTFKLYITDPRTFVKLGREESLAFNFDRDSAERLFSLEVSPSDEIGFSAAFLTGKNLTIQVIGKSIVDVTDLVQKPSKTFVLSPAHGVARLPAQEVSQLIGGKPGKVYIRLSAERDTNVNFKSLAGKGAATNIRLVERLTHSTQ